MMFMTLVPPDERKPLAGRFQSACAELNAIPGLRAGVQDLSSSGLHRAAWLPHRVLGARRDFGELVEVMRDVTEPSCNRAAWWWTSTRTTSVGMPELRIVPDRARASDLGVSIEQVGAAQRARGRRARGPYTTGGRRIDVRVRLLAEQRSRP
jgi:multidrug efflux pump subunit AcrB